MTPLGLPVVPPVPTSIASVVRRVVGCILVEDSVGRCHSGTRVQSSSLVEADQTVVSRGSDGRICATRWANDAWYSSATQSKRSSNSPFSAASLRGLIGHHTAPAREMPKTHANAIGSFADRIATDCPGWTPERVQRGRDPMAEPLHLAVAAGLARHGQAGRVGAERRALVEVLRPVRSRRLATCAR